MLKLRPALCGIIRVSCVAALCCRSTLLLRAAETGQRALLRGNETMEKAVVDRFEANSVTFRADGKEQQLPLEKLVRWGHFVEATRGAQVLLADGSLLVGRVQEWNGTQIKLQSEHLGALAIPLEKVIGVVWQVPQQASSRDRLLRNLEKAQGNQDSVYLPNGDRLTGTVNGLQGDQIALDGENGASKLPLSRVVAIGLNPTLIEKPTDKSSHFAIGLADGSQLMLDSLHLEGQQWKASLLVGLACTMPRTSVVAWQNLAGGVVFLSDLAPVKYQQVPLLQLNWPLGVDRNCDGDRLRCNGRLYLKGLGMHAPAAAMYHLDHEYRLLCGELGIDDQVGLQGSALFDVDTASEADGKMTWTHMWNNSIFRGHDDTKRFAIELKGARWLRLRAEAADRGEERDFANWLDVRLEP